MPEPASPNRLLALLPDEERQPLVTQAETVSLNPHEEVYPTTGPIENVYFPLNVAASILIDDGRGEAVEIATIGNEGMLGSAVVLGIPYAWGRTLVPVAGTALRLRVEALRARLEQQPVLRTLLTRYLYALIRHIAQAGACQHLHSMEARCARWLLMLQDRVGRETFVLTQQFLSEILSARLATVNLVLQRFKRAGMIAYVRGRIEIVDRAGLEAVSCPCYTIMMAAYQRVLAV
jgi:CRP-like cAMP-binding protein